MPQTAEAAVWTPEKIRELLEKNDTMLERSVVKIYEKQTEDEQNTETTRMTNGVGFTGCDAGILSSFAKQIMQSTYPESRRLSFKQRAIARRRMKKYGTQLAKIANAGRS